MKTVTLLIITSLLTTGCVTRKIHVLPEAEKITVLSPALAKQEHCQIIATHTIKDAHPNNVDRELKNTTFIKGGNHYAIVNVLDTRRSRPSSVVAEIYNCTNTTAVNNNHTILPGAEIVLPLRISETEANACRLLNTEVVKSTNPNNLQTQIANQTYMLGGNRFHITQVIEMKKHLPSSVVIDAYRCKTTTIAN
ncbi:hypothetical protein PMAL9190_01238 [Photobacterium malacitanum]|uniref:DUF1471 domain-containing protein n=1 Tax=Photobacterium malacitanum TaxID=2204294 RepID=A0A1Y6MCZ2_9GAMM|nr:DUF1471 domain-containing protein [Photobacterium malacitanum]SMY33779.1 hypothetical protein PMAL9190_01238 [Photobacterium malacitanum]